MHLGHPREGSETAPCPGPEGKRGRAEGSINIGRDGHCGSGTAHDLESAERSHARRQGGRSCPSSGARDVGTRLEKGTHLLRQWGGRAKRGRGRARGHPARGRRSTWPHARHPLAGARAGRLTCSTACSPSHGGGDGAPRSTAARPGLRGCDRETGRCDLDKATSRERASTAGAPPLLHTVLAPSLEKGPQKMTAPPEGFWAGPEGAQASRPPERAGGS